MEVDYLSRSGNDEVHLMLKSKNNLRINYAFRTMIDNSVSEPEHGCWRGDDSFWPGTRRRLPLFAFCSHAPHTVIANRQH